MTPFINTSSLDPNNLAYWYPRLLACGLPMPKTLLVRAHEEELSDIANVFEGQEMTCASEPFFKRLTEAAQEIGYPLFLRTGHTAGKQNWRHTCYVAKERELRDHAIALVEYSDIISFSRFSLEWWAVREFLPLTPVAHAPLFTDLPICREVRAFAVDGKVKCIHPYWSERFLEQGGVSEFTAVYNALKDIKDEDYVKDLAARAAQAAGPGAWSVDILSTERGWNVIGMAEAAKSYHMSGCANRFD